MHRIVSALFLGLSVLVANTVSASSLPEEAVPAPLQTTQTPASTSAPGGTEAPAPAGPPLSLTVTLLGLCCAFLILIGVVILGFVVRRDNRQTVKNE